MLGAISAVQGSNPRMCILILFQCVKAKQLMKASFAKVCGHIELSLPLFLLQQLRLDFNYTTSHARSTQTNILRGARARALLRRGKDGSRTRTVSKRKAIVNKVFDFFLILW